MRLIIAMLIFSLEWLPQSSWAQTNLQSQLEQDACYAIPVCGNVNIPYLYKGYGGILEQPSNCFFEANSVWLKLTIASSGILVFAINPVNSSTNFNFSIIDGTGLNCNNIALANAVRCHFWTGTGPTGLSIAPGNSGFANALSVNSGEVFYILIDRPNTAFPTTASGFSLDFTGSTATFLNNELPRFALIKNTCNKSQEVTTRMNIPVLCNSIAADGSDFYITPSLSSINNAFALKCVQSPTSSLFSFTTDITLQFTTPLPVGNYWLHIKAGNGLKDVCGNGAVVGDSILFVVDSYSSISFTGLDSPACQFLLVGLSHRIVCDSIASDGSDFKILGPAPQSIISAIGTNCDINGLADSILISLQKSIEIDGTYYLVSQKGTDNNSLLDTCTGHQIPGDKISFNVNSFTGKLIASSDTILCKADTIQLASNYLSGNGNNYCGKVIETEDDDCFSITKELTGIPGSTFYSRTSGYSVFDEMKGFRRQMLFRASELHALGLNEGKIIKIAWVVDSTLSAIPSFPPSPATFINYDNFTIKIGCTSQMEIGGSAAMIPGLQTVFTTTGFTPIGGPVGVLNEFVLDTAYVWNGLDNIIIEVCGSANQITGLRAAVTKTSVTSFSSNITFQSVITEDGCSFDHPLLLGGGGYHPFFRPDTYITICGFPLNEESPYSWSPAESILGDTVILNPLALPLHSTTYAVTTVNKFGCYLRDTVLAVVSTLNSSLYPIDTTVCMGTSVALMADAGTNPGFYSWMSNNPSTLTCLDCSTTISTPIHSTTYKVKISDQYGCVDTLETNVHINPLPVIVAFPDDTTIKYDSGLQLYAKGGSLFSWTPIGSLNDAAINNPLATPLETTNYVVLGIDSNGCRNTDTVKVRVDFRDHLFIPGAFSPNGDGKNDLFKVINLSFQRIQEFRVFNRWGPVSI